MNYFRYLIATAFTLLILAAAINYFLDPAGIYRPGLSKPIQFVGALLNSENGLWWPAGSIDERAIKKELAKYSKDAECVIVGSSHIMQIGSTRRTKVLKEVCSSIINLGVSGASIEDHFALSFLSMSGGTPKRIVLGIDPWTLAFGKDQRWSYYAEDYRKAKGEIQGESSSNKHHEDSSFQSKLRNLFSLEYTNRSIRKGMRELRSPLTSQGIIAAPKLDEAVGGVHPVFLRDGAIQYSAEYIEASGTATIRLGGDVYKTDGYLNDAGAIKAYKSLLRWIKSKGVEPILLLTPYHQNVWRAPSSFNTRALVATEPIVRAIGKELGVRVIGTYNPDAAGCLETEFLDFMHPKMDCMARLVERQD
jgi:hypothetical protein